VFYVILGLSFLLRGGIALIVNYTELIPNKYILDSDYYQWLAIRIFEGKTIFPVVPVVWNYAWLLSRLYYYFGVVPLAAHMISAALGVVVVRNIYRTTELIAGSTAGILVAAIWAVLPSVVLVTSLTTRDPIILFSVTTLCYWMVKFESGKAKSLILLGIGILLFATTMCFFRTHQMVYILTSIGAAGAVTFGWNRKKPRRVLLGVRILAGVAILIFSFMVIGRSGCTVDIRKVMNSKLPFFTTTSAIRAKLIHPKKTKPYSASFASPVVDVLSRALAISSGLRKGNSGTKYWISDASDRLNWSLAYRLPLRSVIYVLSPFPWQVESTFLKVAVAENLIFYVFLIAGAFWLPYFYRARFEMAHFIVIYIFLSIFMYGLLQGNIGTGYRHRMQFIWILFIPGAAFFAGYIDRWMDRKK